MSSGYPAPEIESWGTILDEPYIASLVLAGVYSFFGVTITDLHRELSLVRIQVGQPASRTNVSLRASGWIFTRHFRQLSPVTR